MLIITEKDIENRKASIKASLNYYSRQMKRKNIHSQYEQAFFNGCDALIQSLNNVKTSLFHLYLIEDEKKATAVKKIKQEIEKVFLGTKVYQTDLIQEARNIIRSA